MIKAIFVSFLLRMVKVLDWYHHIRLLEYLTEKPECNEMKKKTTNEFEIRHSVFKVDHILFSKKKKRKHEKKLKNS